jgi:isopentenyl-diphosphate Delta-isomerase
MERPTSDASPTPVPEDQSAENARREAVSRQRPSKALPIWEEITLLPNPLPEIDEIHVDLRCRVLNHNVLMPVMIEPDGSRSSARPVALERLAAAADRHGAFFSFGDLQPAFDKPSVYGELRTIRDNHPTVVTFAELPASRLIPQPDMALLELSQVQRAVTDLDLNGILINLNGIQQSFRSRYGAAAAGTLPMLEELCTLVNVPVIARALTGIPRNITRIMIERGVAGVVVGGAEVLDDWLRENKPSQSDLVERYRARQEAFHGWGMPTVAAIRMLRGIGVPVISDGRILTGLDAAKAMVLGANLIGLRLSGSRSGEDSEAAIEADVARFAADLRAAMFLAGAANLVTLPHTPFVAVGETREWLEAAETLWKQDQL